jgi:hypothetical protein
MLTSLGLQLLDYTLNPSYYRKSGYILAEKGKDKVRLQG